MTDDEGHIAPVRACSSSLTFVGGMELRNRGRVAWSRDPEDSWGMIGP